MLSKWSQKEDQNLARIIRKHGTTNWALIRRHFKSNRTRDSVITIIDDSSPFSLIYTLFLKMQAHGCKRWHGKLKYEKNNQTLPQPENQKTNNNKAPPAIRKNRGEPSQHGNRKGTRSDSQNLQIDQEKAAKMIIQKPNDSRRFQRLRSFLENTNNTRQKSKTIRALKKQEMIEDENKQDEKGEDSNFEYQHEWTKLQDEKLRSAVLNESITSWKKLAELMGCSERELKKRWKNQIYKIIKLQDKVGGFLKYSIDEDTILTIAHRNGLRWEEMMVFLPGRSEFSIEARWRRLARSEFEVQLSKNKHFMMRQFLKKIVEKRKTEREPVDLNSQLELLKY